MKEIKIMNATRPRGTGVASEIYSDGQYLENNLTWHAEDSPWKAAQIAKIIEKNQLSLSTICEIGCGAGEVLNQLSQKYPAATFVGYEISPQAFDLCRKKEHARLTFHNENLFEVNKYFDCLLCIDVFEHVEDYMGFLKGLKKAADYKIFHIPLDLSVQSVLRSRPILNKRSTLGHLHYFTEETAIATLQDCGYRIIDVAYTASCFDLPSKTLRGRIVDSVRKLLFPISPRHLVRILGGCSLLVLAT